MGVKLSQFYLPARQSSLLMRSGKQIIVLLTAEIGHIKQHPGSLCRATSSARKSGSKIFRDLWLFGTFAVHFASAFNQSFKNLEVEHIGVGMWGP